MNYEDVTAVKLAKIRRTIDALRCDGYQGHDPKERLGYLKALLDVQDRLLGGDDEKVS